MAPKFWQRMRDELIATTTESLTGPVGNAFDHNFSKMKRRTILLCNSFISGEKYKAMCNVVLKHWDLFILD
jgi:hypothetical protein